MSVAIRCWVLLAVVAVAAGAALAAWGTYTGPDGYRGACAHQSCDSEPDLGAP